MTESTIRYETPAPGVARIVLARADKHNAINPQMIYDVNEAFNTREYFEEGAIIFNVYNLAFYNFTFFNSIWQCIPWMRSELF